MLYHLWRAVEDAGDWERIFWDCGPSPYVGDLEHWVYYMEDVTLLIVQAEGNLAGMIWFNEFQDHACNVNIWIDPKFRGYVTRQASEMACKYAFEKLNVDRLIGLSPWTCVHNLAHKVGFKDIEDRDYVRDDSEVVKIKVMERKKG